MLSGSVATGFPSIETYITFQSWRVSGRLRLLAPVERLLSRSAGMRRAGPEWGLWPGRVPKVARGAHIAFTNRRPPPDLSHLASLSSTADFSVRFRFTHPLASLTYHGASYWQILT